MAQWSGNKINPENINNGEEYRQIDKPTRQQLNAIVNNSLFASNIAENVAEQLSSLNADDKIEFKGSNPNLLINGDFRINQRGLDLYTEAEHETVDRWKLIGQGSSLTVLDKGVRVTLPTQYRRFRQVLDLSEYSFLLGATVTCSCKILNYSSSGGLVFEINDGINENPRVTINGSGIFTFTRTISSNATQIWVDFYQTTAVTSTFDVEWVKMELGFVATTFIPKLHSQEFSDCARYFKRFGSTSGSNMIAYGISSGSSGYFPFKTDVPMRTRPSIICDTSLIDIYTGEAGSSVQVTGIEISNYSTTLNEFTIKATFSGVAKQGYILRLKAGGYIDFDAEADL